MLPTSTAVLYLATGLGGVGRLMCSSWMRVSGLEGMCVSLRCPREVGRSPLLCARAGGGQGLACLWACFSCCWSAFSNAFICLFVWASAAWWPETLPWWAWYVLVPGLAEASFCWAASSLAWRASAFFHRTAYSRAQVRNS